MGGVCQSAAQVDNTAADNLATLPVVLLVWERLVTKLEPGVTRMHLDSVLSELVAEMLNARFRK